MNFCLLLFVFLSFTYCCCGEANEGSFKFLTKIFEQCSKHVSPVKCLKVQFLKFAERANNAPSIDITESLSVVNVYNLTNVTNSNNQSQSWDNLSSEKLDEMLMESTARFLSSRQVRISMPRRLIEEGRGKMKKYMGPALVTMLGVKAAFLHMLYKSIAAMSATAILIGKMALLLSAIVGLKHLLHHEPHSQTIEIVKHPQHSHKHTHSTSHDEDHSYKNFASHEEMMMEDKTYKTPLPYQYYKY